MATIHRSFPVFEADAELLDAVKQTDRVVLKLADAYRPMQTSRLRSPPATPRRASLRRADRVGQARQCWPRANCPTGAGLDKQAAEQLMGYRQIVARWADNIAVQVAKTRWSLYDAGGRGLFVVPALEPTALEADRHRSEIYPWISLYALLEGSDDLLQGYPPNGVRQIRQTWNAARDAYQDRGAADRREKFSAAMRQFTGGLRTLAAEIEPVRALPIIERDKGLLAKTAYPRAVATDAEVFYNQFHPFHWAWIASLSAATVLALSFTCLRRPEHECKRSREQELHRTHRRHCHLRRHLRAHHPEIHSQNSA